MTVLGTSKSGGKIVEFTVDEYRAFVDAQRAMKGLVFTDIWHLGPEENLTADMKQFLQAFRAFVMAKFKTNEIQRLVDDLRATVGIKTVITPSR